MPARLRSEGIVLVPALAAVGLLVYWGAHGGGYAPTTWEPSALVVLGLLVATIAGIGLDRIRLARPAAVALAALAAYVAWSYLSIAWAAAPGDALEGGNRALVYLLLFALFAILPWRTWSALVALATFALGVGVLAIVTLARAGDAGQVVGLFSHGRLISPLGYENATAAFLLAGAILSVALAARRELPIWLRPLLLAGATAALQAAVLCESRGWLFALPVVLVVTIALVPQRVRFVLWTLPPIAGTLIALPALLHVYERFDAVDRTVSLAAAQRALAGPASHAAAVALPACAAVLLAGLALAWADRRVTIPAGVARGASRAGAALAIAAGLAVLVGGFVAADGRPDRKIAHYWERSNGYRAADAGSSRFGRVGSTRPDFWRVALDAFAAHPVQGLGQDNWGAYYLRHRRSREQPRWTHSLELRLLAHTGAVGFLLLLGALAAALVAALRGRRRSDPLARAVAASALVPFVVWFVHGSIDWFWEMPALSGPAFAFLGVATVLPRDEQAPAPPRARKLTLGRQRLLLDVLGAVALLAALVLGLSFLAEREVAHAAATWRKNPQAALDGLRRAADLNPLSARPDVTAGVIALQLDRPALARARLTRALRREPENWFAFFARGLAASAAGDRAAARADLAHAHALDPREALIADALARVDTRRPLTAHEAFAAMLRDVDALTGKAPRATHP